MMGGTTRGKRCICCFAVLMLGACSTEQAYHSVKGWQKNQCERHVDMRERQQCLEGADTSYGEYKQQTSTPSSTDQGRQ